MSRWILLLEKVGNGFERFINGFESAERSALFLFGRDPFLVRRGGQESGRAFGTRSALLPGRQQRRSSNKASIPHTEIHFRLHVFPTYLNLKPYFWIIKKTFILSKSFTYSKIYDSSRVL